MSLLPLSNLLNVPLDGISLISDNARSPSSSQSKMIRDIPTARRLKRQSIVFEADTRWAASDDCESNGQLASPAITLPAMTTNESPAVFEKLSATTIRPRSVSLDMLYEASLKESVPISKTTPFCNDSVKKPKVGSPSALSEQLSAVTSEALHQAVLLSQSSSKEASKQLSKLRLPSPPRPHDHQQWLPRSSVA